MARVISGRADRVELPLFFAVLVVAGLCCKVPFADPNLCIDREARADRVVAGMARHSAGRCHHCQDLLAADRLSPMYSICQFPQHKEYLR